MQVVVRALKVLRHLGVHREGQTLQELSDALETPVATMHRLLAVLVGQEFVARSEETKQYTLGPSSLALAQGVRRVADVARPQLRGLSAATGETVFVTELVGDRAVCVALEEGTRPLRLFVRIGQELPMHAAASARALIAFLDETKVDGILGSRDLARFTDETPSTVSAVRAHLNDVRERGYDTCDQELDPNVWAVGAPIRDSSGAVVASVSLASPADRMDSVTRKRVIGLVGEAADAISASLGHIPLKKES